MRTGVRAVAAAYALSFAMTAPSGLVAASSPAAEFDPLAPGGISIGMKAVKADEELLVNGFDSFEGGRFYVRKQGETTLYFSFRTGAYMTFVAAEPITYLAYEVLKMGPSEPVDVIVKKLGDKIGTTRTCEIENERSARCRWSSPPRAPLVAHVDVWYVRDQFMKLHLRGVELK